ncbi:MAG: GFA family protein [Rhizobiales bacterium]|nr:GFA family protein [Hyphomicrobiales bacterium]NRB14034.1 GFA family protein [Hyphomicrobiales bacterium]
MTIAKGGCLCGKLRYAVKGQPQRLTYCYCKYCQRATGGGNLVSPVFDSANVEITHGKAKIYEHRSEGSGKLMYVHFCDQCGTKILHTYERFADVTGLYGGTFDDPNWFDRNPETTKYIYLGVAQNNTVIPAGFPTFDEHASNIDGSLNQTKVFDVHTLLD